MLHVYRSLLVLMVPCLLLTMVGCSGKRSSLLLERKARGQVAYEKQYGTRQVVYAYPPEHVATQQDVEITVKFYSLADLGDYFKRKELFGSDAGANPFYPQNLVFYVQIRNNSNKRITIDPAEFYLVDDLGAQYTLMSIDYLEALANEKMGVADMTRMGLKKAPDVYGVDVGGFASGIVPTSRKRFALLKRVSLSKGPLLPGVVYDGFIFFIRPHKDAKDIKLILSNVKTDFDPGNLPKRSMNFTYDFELVQAIVKELPPEPDMPDADEDAEDVESQVLSITDE
jgi:hypothetical protein